MEAEAGAKKGKILVALGPSPNSSHLVRWAYRHAAALGWEWLALHVDSGARFGKEDSARLEATLSLARRLGAEVLVVESSQVAEAIVETARQVKATTIVIGRSGLSRLGILPRRPTVSDRIVREAAPIDVAVVQDAELAAKGMTLREIATLFEAPAREYALLAASFVFMTGLGYLLKPYIGYRSIALSYLAAVLALSFLARPLPVSLFTVLSALVLNYLFMEPRFTLRIATTEDLVLFLMYFLVAFATGALVARLRLKESLLSERERRNAFLLDSTQRLAECRSAEEAAKASVAIVRRFCAAEALFLIPGTNGLSALDDAGKKEEPDPSTVKAAYLAFSEQKICGRGTEFAPESRFRCIPAAAGSYPVGVLALVPPEGKAWKKGDDSLILALGRTFALIVERERAEETERKASLSIESERLSKILLDSVSHELRTPLTTITGSMSALRDESLEARPEARKDLVDGALEAADRLNRIVEDILSMSRIESGSLRLSLSLVDLEDLVNEALAAAGPLLNPARVSTSLPVTPEPAILDLGLAARLAGNLLRNAALYSPPGSPIEFGLEEAEGRLVLRIRDHGPGLPEEDLEAVFERFRRGRGNHGGGLGLGLAICKGIASAHGGHIEAHNAPGGGLEVVAVFPSCVGEAGA